MENNNSHCNHMTEEEFNQKMQSQINSIQAKEYSEEDLKKTLENEEKIIEKVKNNKPLKKYLDDVKLLFLMINDYSRGNYKKVPVRTIITVILTLLYVLSPIDLIPDIIVALGYADDAVLVGWCLRNISKDFAEYKEWKTIPN